MTRRRLFSALAVLLGAAGILAPRALRADEEYVQLRPSREVRDAVGVVRPEAGTVACWLRFVPGRARRDHAIFHTDDSRIVLLIDTYWSAGKGREIVRIGARAGGNLRARGDDGADGFPEASIIVDPDGSLADYVHSSYTPARIAEGEWRHVAMTWEGSPRGRVRIYLDGRLMGERAYDERYSDGTSPFRYYSVGFRPDFYAGERTTAGEMRPVTDMSMASGGIEARDLRVYRAALGAAELVRLADDGTR